MHEQIERDAAVARARAERMTAGYLAAVAEIERAGESLASPFSRAIAEANRWRDNVLTRLAEVAGGQADYVERVVEVNEIAAARIEAAWAEEAEHRLWASRHWEDGVTRALRDIADEAGDSAFAMESVTRDAVEGMTDALAEFVTTGKLDFSGLVNHIITELARIAIRKHIIEPLAEGLEGLFKTDSTPPNRNPIAGGIGLPPGGTAGLLHTGGIAGQLRPGEVPIIVEKGEEVLSESNPRHIRNLGAQPPAVYINFVNQGTGQREMGREVRFDPRGLFITLMTEDVAEGGPMSRGLERAYGLQRRGA